MSYLPTALQRPATRTIPLVAFALSIAAVVAVGGAAATPATGVSGTIVANAALAAPIPSSFTIGEHDSHTDSNVQNIQIGRYTAEPGAQFGWHQHGGPVWVAITSGTLHLYSGDDPECHPREFPAGSGFLDPGNHTHIARNETSEPVELYAVYMLPEGGALRVDQPVPGNCAF